MKLKIGVKGKVISEGRYEGWYILIEYIGPGVPDDDPYMVYYSEEGKDTPTYDSYCIDLQNVRNNLSELVIEWPDEAESD